MRKKKDFSAILDTNMTIISHFILGYDILCKQKGQVVSFKFSYQERAALRGRSLLQIGIYVMAIRPYMDYATGFVGIKRGISQQSIAEELYEEPGPGITGGSPSKGQIKRGINALIKAGLITRHSRYKKMILRCELAETDLTEANSFVQEKASLKPTPLDDLSKRQNEHLESGSYEIFTAEEDATKIAKAATPPVSENTNTLSQEKSSSNFISEGFQPSPIIIEKAKQHDCPTATCRDELAKFISFHQSKGNRRCNWNAEFLGWLLRAKQYHQERKNVKQSHSCKKRYSGNKNQSAVDRVFNANQELISSEVPIYDGRVIENYG